MTPGRYAGVKLTVLGTLLLLVLYEINTQRFSSRGVYKQTITKNSSLIWPRETVETNDRISNQLELLTDFRWLGRLSATKPKLIYHVPHHNYGDPTPEGQHLFTKEKCPAQLPCIITRKLKDLKDADAVYLENFDPSMLKDLLPKRRNQVWIVYGREPPPISSQMRLFDSQALGNLVNWTMVYRRDATIPIPYGKFVTFPNFTRIEDYRSSADNVNYATGKTKKIAWLVSNCDFGINSGRDSYAEELGKHFAIDVYGKCGTLKCPKEDWFECQQMLKRDYKFYLAFENNCCRDYVTEKFFRNALMNDVIPVVLGAHPDDYRSLAPPGSYIHVDDFESPKQLADYLHLLDKNDTLYNEYFRWKRTGTFISTSPFCRMCALLHANDDGSYVHWYPSFQRWWEEGVCLEKSKPGQWQSWRNKIHVRS